MKQMQAPGFELIFSGLSIINGDEHHLQWIGIIPPEGFVYDGRLFSKALILFNSNFFLFILTSVFVGMVLSLIEFSSSVFVKLYNLSNSYHVFVKLLLVSVFFINFGRLEFYLCLVFIIFLSIPKSIFSKRYIRGI